MTVIDSSTTAGFPIKCYTRSLGLWVKVYDTVFKEIWDGSALGNRKLNASGQKHLVLTRHPEGWVLLGKVS